MWVLAKRPSTARLKQASDTLVVPTSGRGHQHATCHIAQQDGDKRAHFHHAIAPCELHAHSAREADRQI
jgi:hypothetical protein